MSNLTELNLSRNKFKRISKKNFANLQKLSKLNFAFNDFKKLGPQMFTTLTALTDLKVDKFGGYKMVRKMSSSLQELSLTTRLWACNFVANVAELLNKQRIYMHFNDGDDFENFNCPKSSSEVNRL